MGIDTEYNSPIPVEAEVLAISLDNGEDTYVLETLRYSKEEMMSLLKQLQKCDTLIAHNAKADALVLRTNYNIRFDNWFCTMLASQIIDNGLAIKVKDKLWYTGKMVGGISHMKSPHGLGGVLERYLSLVLDKTQQATFLEHPSHKPLSTKQLEYAGYDVKYLIPLKESQDKWLEKRNLKVIQYNIECPLIPVLVEMEVNGCAFDVQAHQENLRKWNLELIELETQLNEMVGVKPTVKGVRIGRKIDWLYAVDLWGRMQTVYKDRQPVPINWGSGKQFLNLFEQRGHPVPVSQENSAKFSASKDNLNQYLVQYPNSPMKPLIELFLKRVQLKKKLSTYGQKLIDCVDNDNRMRTSYAQCWAQTGRLASRAVATTKEKRWHRDSGLNLANIPKADELRNLFIADPGYSFCDSDHEGQEVYVAADYSKEPVLLNALESGFDHHSFLASDSFGIIFNRPTVIENKDATIIIDGYTYNLKKELRQEHKNALFSMFYGGGKNRIYEYLGKFINAHNPPKKGLEIAQKVSTKLKANLPVLNKYLNQQVSFAKRHGYCISSKLGRRRYFPDAERVFGDAMNFPIQGTGGESLKIALLKIDSWLRKRAQELGLENTHEFGFIVFSVYDQCVVALNDNYINESVKVQEIMKESLDFFLDDLDAGADIQITKQWQK